MSVDSRARAGLFLAMQYPVEVPGVSVSNFLRTAVTAVRGKAPKLRDFMKEMRGAMRDLAIDPKFAERSLNEGFSGGEKKRHEILQLELLDPKIAILDETDSGLDVDALKVVSEGINRFRAKPGHGVLLGCAVACFHNRTPFPRQPCAKAGIQGPGPHQLRLGPRFRGGDD